MYKPLKLFNTGLLLVIAAIWRFMPVLRNNPVKNDSKATKCTPASYLLDFRATRVPDSSHSITSTKAVFPWSNTDKYWTQVVMQLRKIWDADPRLPSIESRRAWALARDVDPGKVHQWFHRRKYIAKRAGNIVPDEQYELDVGEPPAWMESELSSAPSMRSPASSEDILTTLYLPSSSPRTVFSPLAPEPGTISDPLKEGAYSRPETPQNFTLAELAENSKEVGVLISDDKSLSSLLAFPVYPFKLAPMHPVCTQGVQPCSDMEFICALCDAQTDIDLDIDLERIEDLSTSSDARDLNALFSLDDCQALDSYPRVSLPIDLDTLMELSALPFLDRSPDYPSHQPCVYPLPLSDECSWDGFRHGLQEDSLTPDLYPCSSWPCQKYRRPSSKFRS